VFQDDSSLLLDSVSNASELIVVEGASVAEQFFPLGFLDLRMDGSFQVSVFKRC